jgi:AraC-like DNA-binding protein
MSQDQNSKNFSRYFPVSIRDRRWGLYVTTAGQARIDASQPYPPIGHPKGYHFDWTKRRVLDCYALVYISQGRGFFESKRKTKTVVEAGSAMLLFPGSWHRYRPDDDTGWDEHWLGFDGDIVSRWVKHRFFSQAAPIFKTSQDDRWLVLFSDLIAFIKLNPAALQQVMAGFTAQMLGLLYAGHQVGTSGGVHALSIIQKAIARMRYDTTNNLDAKDLAEELNIGYSSFRHSFQQHTGCSPHKYLMELRLARARNLLEETSLNVKEVAQHAGFEDQHYFCRFFKEKTGRTPSQWRSKLKARLSP